MSVCYIVGAGDFDTQLTLTEKDLVIAADGGYLHLKNIGIKPHLIIGDFDSLGEVATDCERITFPVEKDYTDTALALYEGERRGYKDFVILGGTGGREDHTFANYSLLLEAKNKGLFAKLTSKNGTVFVVKNEKALVKCDTGRHLSLFAFGNEAHGVTVSGLKYEVKDIDVLPESHTTACNLFDGREAEISVKNGALLVFLESDSAIVKFEKI